MSPEYRVIARLFGVPSESPVRIELLGGELAALQEGSCGQFRDTGFIHSSGFAYCPFLKTKLQARDDGQSRNRE